MWGDRQCGDLKKRGVSVFESRVLSRSVIWDWCRCSEITVRPSTRELIQRGLEPEPAKEDLWSVDRPRPPLFKTPIKNQLQLLEAQPAHFECRLVPINDPEMQVRYSYIGIRCPFSGWPRNRENRENREFGSYFFQTGKTQGILL